MMKITLLQTDIKWLDPQTNMGRAARLMDTAPNADLYVLPEMWATGFNTSPTAEMAEMADRALAWMRQLADGRGCAVAGTLAVREPLAENAAKWRNRFFFVFPEEEPAFYDKRNLFAYGGEHLSYLPGEAPVIVAWRGVRFMLQTCFDLRFPETARNALANSYDVLLYAANWPASRRNAWDALLPARAIENQAYCAGVNRTGCDPSCTYDGGTAAYDPYGHPLVQLADGEQAASFEVDLERMHAFRRKFHVLR